MSIGSIHKESGLNLFAGDVLNRQAGTDATKKHDAKEESNTIFAGNLKATAPDTIGTRKAFAQKEAMKIITDQFSRDNEVSGDMDAAKEQRAKLSADAMVAQGEIGDFRKLKEELQESFGISDDSTEQKDLELLRKSMDPSKPLTDEEKSQLENMGPPTEYQQLALAYDHSELMRQQNLDQAISGTISINKSIEATKLALLKSNPMVTAQKAADGVLEAASKEAIGMLINESKEHVDETMEETEEKAEKLAEKKEKEEELAGNDKVPEKESVDENQEMQETAFSKDALDKDLKKILDTNKLLEEDLKGIAIDGTY